MESLSVQARFAHSFCTAWLCTIAHAAQVVSHDAFTTFKLGDESVAALRTPDYKRLDLTHRGLYAFLVHDCPNIFRNAKAIIHVHVGEDTYEMRCIPKKSKINADAARKQVTALLRAVELTAQHGVDGAGEMFVSVGTKGSGNRSVTGRVVGGGVEIRCAVWTKPVQDA